MKELQITFHIRVITPLDDHRTEIRQWLRFVLPLTHKLTVT